MPAQAADAVAVATFAADPALKKFERAVQARLEAVLADSGLAPLDEDRARDLRDNWVDLADPGHLVTAASKDFMTYCQPRWISSYGWNFAERTLSQIESWA